MALTATEEALVRQLIDQQAAILSLAGNESTITSKLGATKVTISDLPNAASIADADLFLLRQGSQEKNVTGAVVKALASSSVSGATTTAAGIIEIATDAEVQTGTDPDRAVTPAGLSARTATETRTGVVELATDAEARAFTANKFIDGAKLASAMTGSNQTLGANGYQKLPGGLVIQWGVTSAFAVDGETTVTLPVAFASAMYVFVPSVIQTSTDSGNTVAYWDQAASSASSARVGLDGNSTSGSLSVSWIAIGS